jgi:hypothetical protein
MRLEFAFFAEAVKSLPEGMFDLLGGGMDLVRGPSYPSTLSSLALVGRMLFEPAEFGKAYELLGKIVNEAGQTIFPEMRLPLEPFANPRHPTRPNWMTIRFQCLNLTFPAAGYYFFHLSIGDQLLGQVIIEAVEEPPK